MLWNDLRYAVRSFAATPLFTAASLATLALGIGVNTAMFSVLHAELFRTLPFREPDRLVRVAERNDKLKLPDWTASALNYLSWKEKAQCFEDIGAIGYASVALTGRGDPEQLDGNQLTPSLLAVVGLRPVIGREFADGEDRPGGVRVAMISEGLWHRRFNGGDIAGQTLTLNGEPYMLIGVVPSEIQVMAKGDVYTPMAIDRSKELRLNHLITVVARLKPGLGVSQAQAEMDRVSALMGKEFLEMRDWGVRLVRFSDWFVPSTLRTALLVLMGSVGLVLCIACGNVANLLLSRAASRQHEVAVRAALGAGRWILARQFLVENLMLAAGGGALGVALAMAAVRWMSAALPARLLPIPGIEVNGPVLLFTVAITILTPLIFGLAPAWQSTRSSVVDVLREGGRSSTAGEVRLNRMLVAGELALATVLLTTAGLLLESLVRMQQVRLGFDSSHLLTFQLSPPPARYPNQVQSWQLYQRLLRVLRAQPEIITATVSSGVPFGAGAYTRTPMAPVGPSVLAPGQSLPVDWRAVSPEYLETFRVPLLRGRFFTAADGPSAPAVAVVSEQTAKVFWGEENPLGRVVRVVGSGKEYTVVGVTGDVLNTALNQPQIPALYFPASQRVWPTMDAALKTRGDPAKAVAAARRAVHDLDPELAMASVQTMDEWISASAAQPRLNALLAGVFAMCALLMAVIGIYGVLALSVSRRTREIGVRVTLGAGRADVLRLILGEGMAVTGAGIAIGVAAGLASARVLSSLLFEARGNDPRVYLAATAVLAFAALIACYVPARRAARLDPVEALRE